ncbi:G0/G1 switch protein 2-like [Platichthys flesus]|uniref:G0/G1 switch protein 2-like n=1 Tax=Platichthys flesus TaxID=8260 RepID=UPI001A886792|nr:G0/G1 switch protein 2-like [Platichthys flesus]XP_062268525.1 G0/G1 switch protein 2-like [Platichthys flesus]
METMRELIPFAKEMLGQKPSRGLLKVYLLGSMFAVLGTIIGLVETVCQPFSSGQWMDAEMVQMFAREQRTVKAESQNNVGGQEGTEENEEEELAHKNGATTLSMTFSKTHRLSHRSMANRLHAS